MEDGHLISSAEFLQAETSMDPTTVISIAAKALEPLPETTAGATKAGTTIAATTTTTTKGTTPEATVPTSKKDSTTQKSQLVALQARC